MRGGGSMRGGGAGRAGWGEAVGGVCGRQGWGGVERGVVAEFSAEQVTGVHGAGSVCGAGANAVDAQWETGPAITARAGRDGVGAKEGICWATDGGGRNALWNLAAGAGSRAGGNPRELFQDRGTFPASGAGGFAHAGEFSCGASAAAD